MVVGLARILYVENEDFWRGLVTRRLQDHHVDAVDSLPAAITLLDSKAPYDVALVDLNLEGDNDAQGADLLDLLRRRYPETKRIVVTGNPPAGGIRKQIFERFDVEELIIKKDLELPDLRRAVEEAIATGAGELPQSLRLNRSAVRQRFRDWQRVLANRLREERRGAEAHLADASGVSPQSRQLAQQAVAKARDTEAAFRERSTELRRILADINTDQDLDAALDALEHAEEEFGDDELGDDA
jgi:CheY-like chemotaxis protein